MDSFQRSCVSIPSQRLWLVKPGVVVSIHTKSTTGNPEILITEPHKLKLKSYTTDQPKHNEFYILACLLVLIKDICSCKTFM